jgi:hypothetical protein
MSGAKRVEFTIKQGGEVVTATLEITEAFSLTEVVDAALAGMFPMTTTATQKQWPSLPTGAMTKLALAPDQVIGRIHDQPRQPVHVVLNSCGRALPDDTKLYARPADTSLRYVRAPSRKDPKYHEEWPEIEGGPVFDGVTYCNDLFEALKRYNVIVAETLPEGAVDE